MPNPCVVPIRPVLVRAVRRLAPLLALVLAGGAVAHDGFTVGISGSLSGSAPVTALRAALPLATIEAVPGGDPVEVALRGDLGWTPGALPAPALGVQLGSEHGSIESYAGAGIGAGFGAPGGVLLSGYVLGGVRWEAVPRLGLAVEATFGASSGRIVPALGVAAEYGFGSVRGGER